MNTEYAVASHWAGDFDEAALQTWAQKLRAQLLAPRVSLGLVFMTPRFFPHARAVLEVLRVHAQIPLLAGCSSTSLIVNRQELEDAGGLVLALYHLPDGQLDGIHFTQDHVENSGDAGFWEQQTGVSRDRTNGWLAFVDPFNLDSEAWLRSWSETYAPQPIVGGLASGDSRAQETQVYLNGEMFEEGGVAISIGGDVRLSSVISQGCTPIGEPWTLTKVEQNLIHQIGNRPAYEVLAETFNHLTADQQKNSRGNLFIGIVTNEYLEEFHRGDFLVRNLLGADPSSGIVAVGALPRLGQTVQFQRRDALAATEDMHALLSRAKRQLAGVPIYGACLCCCNGRGRHLFGAPDHDARMVQEEIGPIGMSGFFCNGEIGPIGGKNFLHGYTASLALFVKR